MADNNQTNTSDLVIKGGYYVAPTGHAKVIRKSGTWGTAFPASSIVKLQDIKIRSTRILDQSASKHSK